MRFWEYKYFDFEKQIFTANEKDIYVLSALDLSLNYNEIFDIIKLVSNISNDRIGDVRLTIKNIVNVVGWENLTSLEKRYCINLCCQPTNELAIQTMILNGKTQEEATNEIINNQKELYKFRLKEGVDFSEFMDARLIFLGQSIPDESLSEQVRSKLDIIFNNSRFEVSLGRWVSGKREINKVTTDNELQVLIDTYNLPINQQGLIDEIKQTIDYNINRLY